MKTEHSAGPWSVGFPGNVINHAAGNIGAVNTHPDNMVGAAERGAANIKLIAAAPDLLAALYSIATDPSAVFDGPNAFLGNLARAAIAKATTL